MKIPWILARRWHLGAQVKPELGMYGGHTSETSARSAITFRALFGGSSTAGWPMGACWPSRLDGLRSPKPGDRRGLLAAVGVVAWAVCREAWSAAIPPHTRATTDPVRRNLPCMS